MAMDAIAASKTCKGKPLPASHAEILRDVTEIMQDVFDADDLEISAETSAEDVEEWDSLSHIRLIVAIERKFKFKFNNSEIEGLKNVGDLVNVIATKLT
jgi:acyl carrier protein